MSEIKSIMYLIQVLLQHVSLSHADVNPPECSFWAWKSLRNDYHWKNVCKTKKLEPIFAVNSTSKSVIYLQIKGRNKTHDSNIQPGLQLKSHTQGVEHKVAEILSNFQVLRTWNFWDWLTVAVIVNGYLLWISCSTIEIVEKSQTFVTLFIKNPTTGNSFLPADLQSADWMW